MLSTHEIAGDMSGEPKSQDSNSIPRHGIRESFKDVLSRLIFTSKPISKTTALNPSRLDDPLLQILGKSRSAASQYTISLPTATVLPKTSLLMVSQPVRGVKRPRKPARPAKTTSPMTFAGNLSPRGLIQSKLSSQADNHLTEVDRQVPGSIASLSSSKASSLLVSGVRGTPAECIHPGTLDGPVEGGHDELACHADNIMRMAVDSTMFASSFNTSCSNTFANDLCLDHDDFLNILNEDYESDRSVLESRAARRRGVLSLAKTNAKRIEISADELAAAIS